MIFIGLLNNEELNLPSISTEQYFSENLKREHTFLTKLFKYLKSGPCIAGVMNIVHDVFTNERIDGASYFTDGRYIWPVYFPYYIEKYPERVFIPSDFIEHIVKNDFNIPEISQEKLIEIERLFDKKWQGNE